MYTFGQLKRDIRSRVFPSGEADNLVPSHDKDFVDALIDIQSLVDCQQQDNTEVIPQCATNYKCGMTVIPCPRGMVKKLSIIDTVDPDTHKESATGEDDWCGEICYSEVDFCHVRDYLFLSRQQGGCLPIGLYFGLPFCGHRPYPTPTGEGLPDGLSPLPLGFHYPDASTDRKYGRAGSGVWAKDRTNIYIVPWIQSTETVLVKWDGIKRIWSEGDPVDQDPLLTQAVEEYLRWQDARKWAGGDTSAAAEAYAMARAMLIHQCREETRARGCEPSFARGSAVSAGVAILFYNDADQSFTAKCPTGQTGTSVTETVRAGTVGSPTSVADANNKAKAQAQSQAESVLVCTEVPTTHWNDTPGDYTASCQGEEGAPAPIGQPVRVVKAIGTVASTDSVADANTQAQLQAQNEAEAALKGHCTFFNKEQVASKSCTDGTNTVTATVIAGKYSTQVSQSQADQLAHNAAQSQANFDFTGTVCDGSGVDSFGNTEQIASYTKNCFGKLIIVNVTVPADTFYDHDQNTANQFALNAAGPYAYQYANHLCQLNSPAGTYPVIYPIP